MSIDRLATAITKSTDVGNERGEGGGGGGGGEREVELVERGATYFSYRTITRHHTLYTSAPLAAV